MSERVHDPELLIVGVGYKYGEGILFREFHVFHSMSKFVTFRNHVEKGDVIVAIISTIPMITAEKKLLNRVNLMNSEYYKAKGKKS